MLYIKKDPVTQPCRQLTDIDHSIKMRHRSINSRVLTHRISYIYFGVNPKFMNAILAKLHSIYSA